MVFAFICTLYVPIQSQTLWACLLTISNLYTNTSTKVHNTHAPTTHTNTSTTHKCKKNKYKYKNVFLVFSCQVGTLVRACRDRTISPKCS